MKRPIALCLASLVFISTYAFAGGGSIVCGAVHFIRAAGTEARSTVISLRNMDLINIAIVERITVRDTFGDVVHDSGPATSQPHPLNTDYTPPLDVTSVSPGSSYYIATSHIWPSGALPTNPEAGQNMAVTVQFSKEGNPALFTVEANSRTRETAAPRAERARDTSKCNEVKSG